jgi:hypothetical protein
MGQTVNCNASCCADGKPEIEFRRSVLATENPEVAASVHESLHLRESIEPEIVTKPVKGRSKAEATSAAVKLQSFWRAVLVRRIAKRLARHLVQNHEFFTRAEVLETLSNKRKLASFRSIQPPYTFTSGAVYTGQWLGGFRDGWGKIAYSSGATYEGYWSFSRPHGEGTFSFPRGETYKGRWKNPLSQGMFSLCKTGEGWRESVQDGFEWLWYIEEVRKMPPVNAQRQTVIDSIKKSQRRVAAIQADIQQLGSFKKGKGRDLVELKEADGQYIGEVFNGVKDGFGKLVWNTRDYYEGQWDTGYQHGWGRNVWDDGSFFVGMFKRDNKEGVGEYKWEDGTSYLGEWRDNLMHGCGKYLWPDGRIYEGEWRSGLMQGFGVYTYADGKRYEGGWFQGKKHGVGITVLLDGRTSQLVWKGGKINAVRSQ